MEFVDKVLVAGLMPVATESSKGLMSANDKKYGIQFINLPKNSARKIIQINNAYSQFIVIGFLVTGPFPINFIFSGRSEANNTIYGYHYEKINIHNYFNLYKKENCFYIENKSPNDGCTGFLISTQTIGTENINIDDSFTLLE